MRDYDPEANKEVGASPKGDSQAGDDLQLKRELQLLKGSNGVYVLSTITDLYVLIDYISAYAERRATEARIDGYKQGVRDGWNKSSEGHNAEYSYPNTETAEAEVVAECLAEFAATKEIQSS